MYRDLRLRILLVLLLAFLLAGAAAAEMFSFIHVSDCHITASGKFRENLENIASEVNAMDPKPAFVVVTGDMTEVGLAAEMEKYREAIRTFQMPVYNVPGNHETKWSNLGKTSMRRFFDKDNRYSFTYGNVHFIGMDSSMWMQHHGTIDKSQLSWLKEKLEKAGRDRPTVLFYHHCPGFIPNEADFLKSIRSYNVRLILVGHGHTFKTWKKNGLLFQEGKGSMNDKGGYRIFVVMDDEILSFTKLVGKEKELDAVIPLTSRYNPVTLSYPLNGDKIEGQVRIRALVTPAENRKVEYGIDGEFREASPDPSGTVDLTTTFDGTPGWHTISVRATDPDGMEWTDSTQIRINGKEREAWQVRVSGGVQRDIQVDGDRVYFGTLGGDVYCLDARTGREIWKTGVGSDVVSRAALDKDHVYFGSADGRVFALDKETGKPKWEFKTGGPVQGSPAVGDGKVFIGSGEAAFYAIDAKTGKQVWKYPMERMTQVVPLYMNGAVYFGAWDKHFYALNAKDGSLLWKTLIGINFYFSTANSDPATDGNRIAVNVTPYKPEDADVYCLDAKSGEVIWKLRNPGKSDCGFNSPWVEGNRFYSLSGNGEIYCFDLANGRELWKSSVGQTCVSSKPVVSDGKIYVAGLRGNVVSLDIESGQKQWTYSTGPGYLFGSAAVWNDLVIVPSVDGSVTALYR